MQIHKIQNFVQVMFRPITQKIRPMSGENKQNSLFQVQFSRH